jgi:hypothetical protein
VVGHALISSDKKVSVRESVDKRVSATLLLSLNTIVYFDANGHLDVLFSSVFQI